MSDTPRSRTTHAVWEITLACNLACSHCGSRAGDKRPQELTTAEALDLIRQLAEVGIKEVTLIGGEAYLRRDWPQLVAAIVAQGMKCSMTTGGLGIKAEMARQMAAAGVSVVSVSIDGLEAEHDALRGVPGSWRAAFNALRHLQEAGVTIGANTQINRLSMPVLPQLYELLKDAGFKGWQIQLTVPMGRAADRPEMLLQPYDLLDLFPVLAGLAERALGEGIRIWAGNNVGYFGPYEALLRGGGDPNQHWIGCQAGVSTLGIEADGSIKGCPSLPTTPYTGANIRDLPLATIIESTEALTFNRQVLLEPERALDDLWGFCQSCYYAPICRGGCSWTAHSIFGRRGNNPYCHHRALTLQSRGRQERLVQVERAPGQPFDHGRFELIEEPLGTGTPAVVSGH